MTTKQQSMKTSMLQAAAGKAATVDNLAWLRGIGVRSFLASPDRPATDGNAIGLTQGID